MPPLNSLATWDASSKDNGLFLCELVLEILMSRPSEQKEVDPQELPCVWDLLHNPPLRCLGDLWCRRRWWRWRRCRISRHRSSTHKNPARLPTSNCRWTQWNPRSPTLSSRGRKPNSCTRRCSSNGNRPRWLRCSTTRNQHHRLSHHSRRPLFGSWSMRWRPGPIRRRSFRFWRSPISHFLGSQARFPSKSLQLSVRVTGKKLDAVVCVEANVLWSSDAIDEIADLTVQSKPRTADNQES